MAYNKKSALAKLLCALLAKNLQRFPPNESGNLRVSQTVQHRLFACPFGGLLNHANALSDRCLIVLIVARLKR